MNPNVKLTLYHYFINNLSFSLSGPIILNNLIYQTTKDGKIISKLFVIAILSAIPFNLLAAYLADKYSRSKVIKTGSIIVITICLIYIFTYNNFLNIMYLIFFFRIIGSIGFSIKVNALQALYADSVPKYDLNKLEIYKNASTIAGQIIGLIFNIIFFYINKNSWNIDELKKIIAIGAIINIISEVFLLFLSDEKALKEESNPIEKNNHTLIFSNNIIPYIIVLSRLFLGAAGALMMNFIPILLKQNFSPIFSNIYLILSLILTVSIAMLFDIFEKKKQIYGMILSIFFETILLSSLFVIPVISNFKYLLISLILIQRISGSWHMPLSQSIFMNYTEKNKRSIWNSISLIGWGIGSLFLLLAPKTLDNTGFKKIFILSIVFKLIGGLIRSLLLITI